MLKAAHGLTRCSQGVKVFAQKPDDLSSIPGTHSGRKKLTPTVVFRPYPIQIIIIKTITKIVPSGIAHWLARSSLMAQGY